MKLDAILISVAAFLSGIVWLFFIRGNNFKSILKRKLTAAGYCPAVADYMYAVSQWETGDFNSRLFKELNNPWGMKQPLYRPFAGIPIKDRIDTPQAVPTWAAYKSLSKAVDDLVLYLDYFKYPKCPVPNSVNQWVYVMKTKGYFEESYTYYLSGVNTYYAG